MDVVSQESRFFDAMEHVPQEPGLVSDFTCIENLEYDVWINPPESVRERRKKFSTQMGFRLDKSESGDIGVDTERIMQTSGAVLRNSSLEDEFSSRHSSVSSSTTFDMDLSCNSRRGGECNEQLENFRLPQIRTMVSNQSQSSEGSENGCKVSSSVQKREIEFNCNTPRTPSKLKARLLSKLRSVTCILKRNVEDDKAAENQVQERRTQRVGVRHSKRSLKELSALFTSQDIKAHEGSILTMKFSLDGQYLASAGEDKIVRVWQVVEDERSDTSDIPDADPSCLYFSVNQLSELGPLTVEKDNVNKSRNLRKSPDSACIIFPPKIFRILEKPMHEFRGHDGEILDLSWSKDNCLLSSSVDKTVRLWRVGVEHCLKVFSHSDYVTCIQFNPVTDDYFISGSIDGKVRIWDVNGCQVVDWTETKDIIAAVSYCPDGQGCVVGSITGICRFFNISDNHLQLESQMCLASKKKSPCKRISGFQFSLHDPNKVLVACADSQVRIINRTSVIRKCKGLRSTGNQISASFTSDGKHIISASEDSNVYMWNSNEDSSLSQSKANKSFESFSSDASVALPWPGLKSSTINKKSINSLPFSSSTCFSLTPEYIDSNSKGSATWPEEKLPVSSPWGRKSLMGKSQYKLFKTSCQSSSNSHAWGLVIVTAGWDGRIRSFHNYGLPVPL